MAGITQANLMLMGDRYAGGGVYPQKGQDRIWGSGRLRARLFTDAGMNVPWRRDHGVLKNAPSGSWHFIPVGSGFGVTLPEDVTQLRVAIWWPEPNLGNQDLADIDLSVFDLCGNGPWIDDHSFDTRKKVSIRGDLGGSCYAISI